MRYNIRCVLCEERHRLLYYRIMCIRGGRSLHIHTEKPRDARSPYVCRMQFPLQLCYACTLNKSQGQTLNVVGIDLREDTFSHGQTYVGFGRVRDRHSITVLVRPDRVDINNRVAIRNVVYKRLIQCVTNAS